MLINICRVGVRRMGPSSFQWCPATGQGAMGTSWSRGSSVWTWGGTSSLWGWRSTGTGCPGRLWSLLLWRYSTPAWTRSCAACCRWPCFGRRVGLDDPQRSLPTPTILWFSGCILIATLKINRCWGTKHLFEHEYVLVSLHVLFYMYACVYTYVFTCFYMRIGKRCNIPQLAYFLFAFLLKSCVSGGQKERLELKALPWS